MMHSYNRVTALSRRLRQLGLTALVVGGTALAAQAQFSYGVASSSTIPGTYTDLGTAGTAIATANTDDANSAAQDIGFNFTYNGTVFTQFILNTNGLLRLGASAPSSVTADPIYGQTPEAGPINSTNAADVNLLMPFNFDLTAGTSPTEYRVATTGAAGNRICTIQWKNVADKAVLSGAGGTNLASQYTNFSFQVKLYEANNQIDFVYSSAAVGTNALKYAVVGLKGSSNAAGNDVLAVKGSSAAWSTTTFITGPQQSASVVNAHNFRSTYPPDAGRTYRFQTAPQLDAAVSTIYTLGKLATPSALPQSVQAVITNKGVQALTNVSVALNVTGANSLTDTKTVTSLASGASTVVTFAAYPATLTTGTNNISVTATAANDGNAANNTATYTQLVTANRLAYTNPAANYDYYYYVDTTAVGGVVANKYTINTALGLTDAVVTFNSTKRTNITYKVLVYDASGTGGIPGNILYTSPTQTRPTAGGDVSVSLGGTQVPAGSFYIGVQEASTGGLGILAQDETPLRAGTFLQSFSGGAPWYDLSQYGITTRFAIEVGLGAAPACAAPTTLAVNTITPTTATVTFTAAAGTSGYQIIYGPTGFNPASGGTTVTATASPVTLTGLTPATTYQVYVRSNCTTSGTSLLTAAVSFTTSCAPNTTVTTFPYNQTFDTILAGQSLPCGVTTLDGNGDGTTWRISTENPNSGTNAMRYQGSTLNNVAADDWFFTPALALSPTSAATRYQVAFRYRSAGIATTPSGVESLEVKSGTAATVAGQTNLLYTNAAISSTTYALANGTSAPAVALLPAGASTQYVGFHIKSAANQGNLYIDDLSVTAVTVTATTSPVLLQAVTVFPNPSATGQFDLEIHGANAKNGLEVQVTNTLGQRVYTGAARDNYTNKLDLSTLAPGIYHLLVRNGDETLARQLSIVH